MNLETSYSNVRKMDEFVKADAFPDQHTKTSVEAEVLPEVSSCVDYANVVTMDEAI